MVEPATVRELLTLVAPAMATVDAKVAPPAETTSPLSSEKVLFKNEIGERRHGYTLTGVLIFLGALGAPVMFL